MVREVELGRCGENKQNREQGCGQLFVHYEEVYRCTHCGVPFHRICATVHFQKVREEDEFRNAITKKDVMGEREWYHDDDDVDGKPCATTLVRQSDGSFFCPKCGFNPDMQSMSMRAKT